MAVTDDQMDKLKEWAYEYGLDGVLHDPSDHEIMSAVFDRVEIEGMRTEDEFESIITIDDVPAKEDIADIVAAWERGNEDWLKEHERA